MLLAVADWQLGDVASSSDDADVYEVDYVLLSATIWGIAPMCVVVSSRLTFIVFADGVSFDTFRMERLRFMRQCRKGAR